MRRAAAATCRASRVALLVTLVLGASCERSSPEARQAASADPALLESSQPSVVLVIIDTLRADKLGCYGDPDDTSPEIDALARRGVRFARVLSQSSWTRPSIASMLTSRLPRSIGIYHEKSDVLADRFESLAEVLAAAGYTTLGVTANPNINSAFNFHQGFDHYVDSHHIWFETEGPKKRRPLTDPTLHTARLVFDDLVAEVERRGAPPYYLQANVIEVHQPDDHRIPLREFSEHFPQRRDRSYLRTVRLVSSEIDRLLRRLFALPGFEQTLVIITSDHGQGLSDHAGVERSNGHGLLLYESQILVPLVLWTRDGSLPRGVVVEEPVRLLDLMPTLLDYLDLPVPRGVEGESLMPVIRGQQMPPLPEHMVVETQFHGADVIGVYGDDWNYFEHREPRTGTDPRELQRVGEKERGSRTNQLDSQPETVAVYQAFLEKWEKEHPKVAPARLDRSLSADEKAQLESLGYLE